MFNRHLPPITKNLLLINITMFVITNVLIYKEVIDLNWELGLHYFGFDSFRPFQLITHMFMHASLFDGGDGLGIMHIFSNMLGLYMFGSPLEERLGPKKFLFLYLASGFGAAFLQLGVNHYQFVGHSDSGIEGLIVQLSNFDVPMVGASGCIFGLLAAFGMLFPNAEMIMIMLPIPIKAKYFVVLYGVFELYSGVANFSGDNVAHFAHVGGALIGFITVYYWKRTTIL